MKKVIAFLIILSLFSIGVSAVSMPMPDPCFAPCMPDVLECEDNDCGMECECRMEFAYDAYEWYEEWEPGYEGYGTCFIKEEIPEFSLIGAGLALLGAGYIAYKKRK